MKFSKEIMAVSGVALVVAVGALAVENYNQDQDLLRSDRLAALKQIDNVVSETITLKPGVVINFGPGNVGGDDERQDAYTVKGGTEVTINMPLVSSKTPNIVAVGIPGKDGKLEDKLGWVRLTDQNGKPRTDIEIKPITGLKAMQPASVSPEGHLIAEGRGEIPDAQVAIPEVTSVDE